ncbi:MAG TPA: hypothetical protein VKB46_07440 [Pyrinomonadaceae bacterium]|nr:hypothetical protein [Pyrinomonadaceae bacterium]
MGLKSLLRVMVLLLGILVVSGECSAMPMFARRYNVPCSTCHTSPPRLNETGYRFRAAGFRMPEELGHALEGKQDLLNHIGFRLQPRVMVVHSAIGTATKTENEAQLFASEGYLWYGPISKHFSASAKVTFWPEESTETEQHERFEGVVRFDYGSSDNFIDIRAGVPHPLEGFGGSESYSVANTKPFIQELKTANFNQDTFFTPAGLHQMAVAVGYYHKRTTIRGAVLSGMRLLEDHEHGDLEPFGRKEPLTESMTGSDGGPDVQVFFNQILHPDGGNFSVYYYNGRSMLPRLDLLPPPEVTDPFDNATRVAPEEAADLQFFKNNFQRLAFYAGYPIKKVSLLGGIQYGRDEIGSGGHFSSLGDFAEANVKILNDISVAGVRFDWFDPARVKSNNEITGITPYINIWLRSQLRIAAEYQYQVTRRGPIEPNRRDNIFQLRLYWIK